MPLRRGNPRRLLSNPEPPRRRNKEGGVRDPFFFSTHQNCLTTYERGYAAEGQGEGGGGEEERERSRCQSPLFLVLPLYSGTVYSIGVQYIVGVVGENGKEVASSSPCVVASGGGGREEKRVFACPVTTLAATADGDEEREGHMRAREKKDRHSTVLLLCPE